MTSRTSAARASSRGFTLIEILVVMLIIVVLIGIAVPVVIKGRTAAKRARVAADMAAISVALDAYAADFKGEYPQVDRTGFTDGLNRPANPNGAQVLCAALIGPMNATEVPAPPLAQRPAKDGADGNGFRVGGTVGRIYGPYLQADKFRIGTPGDRDSQPVATINPLKACLLDQNNKPILYLPARKSRPTITAIKGFVASATATPPGRLSPNLTGPAVPLYDLDDVLDGDETEVSAAPGTEWLKIIRHPSDVNNQTAGARFARMLGDKYMNGQIDQNAPDFESPTTTAAYLLWAAGEDERFGPADPANAGQVSACDDVTSFTFAP